MSTPANTCPEYVWCTEDHTKATSSRDFHMQMDRREPGVAVLRVDPVLDAGKPSFDLCDHIDWSIPLDQIPAFIAEMRTELDRIEAMSVKFSTSVHPLVRRTEPGEPELAGIGGGL